MGAHLGAHSARTCSRRLSPARLGTVLTWARTHSCRSPRSGNIPGGQGVAGSNPAVPTVFRTPVPRNGNENCHDHSHLTGQDEQTIQADGQAIPMTALRWPRSRRGAPVRHRPSPAGAGRPRPARQSRNSLPSAGVGAGAQPAQTALFQHRTHRPPHPDPRRQGGPSPG